MFTSKNVLPVSKKNNKKGKTTFSSQTNLSSSESPYSRYRSGTFLKYLCIYLTTISKFPLLLWENKKFFLLASVIIICCKDTMSCGDKHEGYRLPIKAKLVVNPSAVDKEHIWVDHEIKSMV